VEGEGSKLKVADSPFLEGLYEIWFVPRFQASGTQCGRMICSSTAAERFLPEIAGSPAPTIFNIFISLMED
jgi:hypothetical protein